MRNIFEKTNWKKLFEFITYGLILFFIEILIYKVLLNSKLEQYWMIIPVAGVSI